MSTAELAVAVRLADCIEQVDGPDAAQEFLAQMDTTPECGVTR